MNYLFSANFNTSLNFYGSINAPENDVRVVDRCKYEMSKHYKRWGVTPEEITSFEVYYVEDGKEIEVFKWEKE